MGTTVSMAVTLGIAATVNMPTVQALGVLNRVPLIRVPIIQVPAKRVLIKRELLISRIRIAVVTALTVYSTADGTMHSMVSHMAMVHSTVRLPTAISNE